MMVEWLLVPVGVLAGAVATIAGFGVGSLLTPLLSASVDAKLAVALVSVPHAIATLLRLWRLRHDVSMDVLKGFGLASALGGLTGGYLYTQANAQVLARVLGVLLLLVGIGELARLTSRIRLTGWRGVIAGALSGIFGGMVGNQGGVRSAGLLGFGLNPRGFVATGAAIALIVDAVRLPFYVGAQGAAMLERWPLIAVATVAVTVGTFLGSHLLFRLSESTFRRVVAVLLLALGIWMLQT